jgi:outer membrane lipoprotein-sorting protein
MRQSMPRAFFTGATVAMAFLCMGSADKWTGLREAAGKVTSVVAEFTQEKHMKILSHPLVSKGVFYYQTPGSLRWEYQSPFRSIVLMHHGATKRYSQGKEGLTEDTGADLQPLQLVLQEITHWLEGRFDENALFSAGFEEDRKIVLAPRQESVSRLISRIELVLSDTPGLMESVTIYESQDSFTRLTFHDAALNRKIAESIFTDQ